MREIAGKYLESGLCVLPARRIEKRPAIKSWKQYQGRPPTAVELEAWFSNPQDGLCIIAGAVSGNLEMIDFDNGGELFDRWYALVADNSDGLLDKLVIEQTPSGGWHVCYRCQSAIGGNMKLAQRRDNGKVHTLIETRGEGGLFLCAPTAGYELMQGDFGRLSVLSEMEREILLQAAWTLNEHWPDAVDTQPATAVHHDALRPGDDFNQRGDVAAILRKHGWVCVAEYDENQRWRRPGKDRGWSATLRTTDNVFYAFSSNAAPFEPNKAYSPFAVYALLEHGGDYASAAQALSGEGYGEPLRDGNDDDVDISAITGGATEPEDEVPGDDPGSIPDDFFNVPGFINAVIEYCLDTAPYPNRALAFCGALTLQAFLAGRKIIEAGGIRPNIYLLALASSGTGKDWPRKLNAHILNHVNALQCLGDRLASGEGLQDVMQVNLNMLYQTDEMDGMLRAINQSREGRHENIMGTLLTFYTSSDSFFPVRTKAGMTEGRSIRQPSLTIFGTATPKYYYEALSERMLTNGFFSRMIIVDVGQRPLCQMAKPLRDVPPAILEVAEHWQKQVRWGLGNNLSWENPEPPVAPFEGNAGQILFEFQRRCDMEHQAADAFNETAKTVWTRAAENARKLALLYACSANHIRPVISEQAATWAVGFVDRQVKRQLYMASLYAAENEFHAKCLKVKEKLRSAPGKRLPHSVLLKRMKMDRDTFLKVIQTLMEQEELRVVSGDSATRKGAVYVLGR